MISGPPSTATHWIRLLMVCQQCWGGDFQQILPVVPRGNHVDIMAALLQYAGVWRHLEKLLLHLNMHLQGIHSQNHELAEWLARLNHDKSLMSLIPLPDFLR